MITDDEVMRLFERADPARLDDSAPVVDAAGDLDALRTRSIDVTLTRIPQTPTGPTSRHRWRIITAAAAAVVLIAGAAFVLTADGTSPTTDETSRTSDGTSPTTDETSPTTHETTSPTTGGTSPTTDETSAPAWPDPDGGKLFTDPVEAASSFVTLITGVADPPLLEFEPSGAGLGSVGVCGGTREDGEQRTGSPFAGVCGRVAAGVVLRQVGEHWFVSGARSRNVEITTPTVAQEVTSPVAVAGSGYFDGNIVVQLRARTVGAEVLAEDVAPGGSPLSLEPFTAELNFDAAPTRVGFVVAADTPSASEAIPDFAASVVVLGP